MKNKIILLLLFILGMSLSLPAANDWSVNPYDFQYDMTAYVKLQVDGVDVADLNDYEIAAFSGDECRGVLEVKSVSDTQYGYIRIRSNSSSGESISFRIYDKSSDKNLKCSSTLDFAADTSVGLPSNPFVIQAADWSKLSEVEITFSKKQIHLNCPDSENARIIYTIDDIDPTEEYGQEYTGPFLPERDCIIKAIAVLEGYIPSDPTYYRYVAEEHTVPRLYIDPRYRERAIILYTDTKDKFIAHGDSILVMDQPILRAGDEIRPLDFPTEMFNDVAVFEWKSEELLERGPVTIPIEYASSPRIDYDGVTVSIFSNNGKELEYDIFYDDRNYVTEQKRINNGVESFDPYMTGVVEAYVYDNGLFRSEPSMLDFHAVRFDDDQSVMLNRMGWLSQAIGRGEAQGWDSLRVFGPMGRYVSTDTSDFNLIASLSRLETLDLKATSPMQGSVANFNSLRNLKKFSMPLANADLCTWNINNLELLSAIRWNDTSAMREDLFGLISNRNALLYVKDKSLAPSNAVNVVCDGVADHLSLSNNYPFCIMDEFRASEAVFTKNFSKETPVGGSSGWETIVVPFDVDSIVQTGDRAREIKPFLKIESGDDETPGFWLASTGIDETGSSWRDMSEIFAGMPYIIAMPNSPDYMHKFNIVGDVAFIGHDVMVGDELQVSDFIDADSRERHFSGTYMPVSASEYVFSLMEEPNGSVFASAAGDVRPFECSFDGGPGMSKIAIGGGSNAVNVVSATDNSVKIWQEGENVMILSSAEMQTGITDLTGSLIGNVRLRGGEVTVISGLVPGIYIMANHKFLVK